jgi:P27 family predicted phage terminase small subunit
MKNSAAADPRAPKSLSTPAKRWWRAIKAEFSIDDPGGLLVLTAAAEAFDRMKQAQALVDEQGLTVKDRFGQPKSHPAVVIERDARAQMLAALRDLRLDLEPLRDRHGRPAGGNWG